MAQLLLELGMAEKDTAAFVARHMGITPSRAAGLIGCAQETIDEVLAGHYPEETAEQQAALSRQQQQVDLKTISAELDIAVTDLCSWTEDDMVWILYGSNIAEGIAGSGHDCAEASANFYARWYQEITPERPS